MLALRHALRRVVPSRNALSQTLYSKVKDDMAIRKVLERNATDLPDAEFRRVGGPVRWLCTLLLIVGANYFTPPYLEEYNVYANPEKHPSRVPVRGHVVDAGLIVNPHSWPWPFDQFMEPADTVQWIRFVVDDDTSPYVINSLRERGVLLPSYFYVFPPYSRSDNSISELLYGDTVILHQVQPEDLQPPSTFGEFIAPTRTRYCSSAELRPRDVYKSWQSCSLLGVALTGMSFTFLMKSEKLPLPRGFRTMGSMWLVVAMPVWCWLCLVYKTPDFAPATRRALAAAEAATATVVVGPPVAAATV